MDNELINFKVKDYALNLLISSPAGSGKTQKLSDRYISILKKQYEEKHAIFPERIVAITFTEKAASEMKERILSELRSDQAIYKELLKKINKMRISTIHSFFLSLYRRFALEAKLNPQVEILDENQQKELVEKIYNQFAFAKLSEALPISEDLTFLLALFGWNRIKGIIQDFINSRRKIMISTQELIKQKETAYNIFLKEYEILIRNNFEPYKEIKQRYKELFNKSSFSVSGNFLKAYERIKKEQAKLDFDDIEIKLLTLLEDKTIYLNLLYDFDLHFDYLLIDEFQDTNFIQWEIIKKLTEEWFSGLGAKESEGVLPSIFLVGDPKQSIYLFRGANVEVIYLAKQSFERNKKNPALQNRFDIAKEKRNFRSNPKIIEFVNIVFSKLMQQQDQYKEPWKVDYEEFTSARETSNPGEVSFHIFVAGENKNSQELSYIEAQIVSNKIIDLIKEGVQPKDIAILMKARTHLEAFENSLLAANIPFKVHKGKGFFKEKEIEILMSLVKFFFNPEDDISLISILKSPFYQFTNDQLIQLSKYKMSKYKALKIIFPSIYEELKNYINIFKSEHSYLVLNKFLIEKEGYKYFSEKQRYANVIKFLIMLEELEYNSEDKLEIKKTLEYMEKKGDLEKANIIDEEYNALSILTIHSAKGLEFPYVFIVQSASELEKTYENIVSFETINSVDPMEIKANFTIFPSSNDNIYDEYNKRKYEEAKRLFYVACTRAKEKLFITASFHNKPKKNSWLGMLLNHNLIAINNGNVELSKELKNAASIVLYEATIEEKKLERKAITLKKSCIHPLKSLHAYDEKFPSEIVIFRKEYDKNKISLKIIGDILHKVLNQYTKGKISAEAIEKEALNLLDPYSNNNLLYLLQQYLNGIKNSNILEIAKPESNKFSEFPFIYKKNKEIWRGKIDLLIIKEDRILIYDYKSSEQELSEVSAIYKKQLEIYAEAISTIWHSKIIEKYIIHLPSGEILKT